METNTNESMHKKEQDSPLMSQSQNKEMSGIKLSPHEKH